MRSRSLMGFCILFALFSLISTNTKAQIKTTTFNDNIVKEKSIVVKYDNTMITTKGKAVPPQVLAADIRTQFNASIERTLKSGAEEWSITSDMATVLDKLNRIPGVRAFPNYVFHRPDVEIMPFDPNTINNEPTNTGKLFHAPSNTTNSIIKNISNKEFLFTPQVHHSLLDNMIITPTPDSSAGVLYMEDFNDLTRVDSTWTIDTVNETATSWAPFSWDGGYAMVTNGLDLYLPNTETYLVSPMFDFSNLDTTIANYFADYTYASAFEAGYDYFFIAVNAINNGDTASTLYQIDDTDGYIYSDSFIVNEFAGIDSVWFSIGFISDASYQPGFGAFFDDFKILQIPPSPTSDPLLDQQYALNNYGILNSGYSVEGADIDAFSAWEHTTGSDDVIMVVYDDGVDFSHPDLVDNTWINPNEIADNGVDDDENGYIDDVYGWSPIYDDNSFLNPGSFHGTHVAGILGAQGDNGIGISGVAQDVSIINVMIFDEFGSTDAISIMAGYEYISTLLDAGVNITAINQSWGGGGYLGDESDQMFVSVMTDHALDHAEYAALWVVSAGNNASNRDELPYYSYPNNIQSPNLITVASTDDADNLSGFSDYGVFTVDVAAPGSSILSTLPPSTTGVEYGYLSGTSMASPQVSGILALAKAMYPDEDGFDLMTRVLAGNEDVASLNEYTGAGGRVNANGALEGGTDPISTGNTTQFHRTFVDGDALENTGLVNNTGGTLTVTGMTLSGPDADNFYIITEELPTLLDGEAFGILVGFDNAGEAGDLSATLEVSTNAGTATLALVGHEQGWGEPAINPDYVDLGSLTVNQIVTTTFTLTNNGLGDMPYSINQILQTPNEVMSETIESLIQFETSSENHNKGFNDANRKDRIDLLVAQVNLALGETSRASVNYNPEFVPSIYSNNNDEIIFFDDLNDADSVLTNWQFISFGDTEDYWTLQDISTQEEPNNKALLFGDFVNGYQNNVNTVALSPIFDFSNVVLEQGNSLLLNFDADVALEQGWDDFYVLVVQNGELLEEIASTWDGSIPNMQGYNTVSIDIGNYAGEDNIEFWFVGFSDGTIIDGFGAFFDNVKVYQAELPFYAVYSSFLEPEASEEIKVVINPGVISSLNNILITQILNENDIVSVTVPPILFHSASFQIINIPPIALDDTIAALVGDVLMLDEVLSVALENDFDPDTTEVYIEEVYEPVFGSIKTLLDGEMYVAPLTKVTDMISYVITDGFAKDTANIYISVDETPHFPTGSDKQYVFLEDDSLSFSTVGMAAGVGGSNQDITVWGTPLDDNINIDLLDNHSIQFSAEENFFGQTQLMLYVGYHETYEMMDSLLVSLIIVPVNDAPTANFNANIEGSFVSFTNLSNDALDREAGGIIGYEWDFGDGTTSTEKEPSYDYGTTGDFSILLTVTDNDGSTATYSETITILSVSNEVNGGVPTEFAIQQNYPNPFNPSTNINYSLPEASSVTIVVYDLLGQKVAELVNTEKAAGYHTIAFDASALSSGVYIYQIKAGTFTETKKMMLIK